MLYKINISVVNLKIIEGVNKIKYLRQIDLQIIAFIISIFIMNRLGLIRFQSFFMLSTTMLISRIIGAELSDNKEEYVHRGFMNVRNVKMWIIYGVAVMAIGILGYNLHFF